MDKIFVIQSFREIENCPGQFRSHLLDLYGFFTSYSAAEKYLEHHLRDIKKFEWTRNDEGDFVVSDNLFFAIITLEKNDD